MYRKLLEIFILLRLGVYIGYSGPSLSLEYGPAVSVIPGQQL
ncbi:hypothetical protein [Sphingobacterium siyangense]